MLSLQILLGFDEETAAKTKIKFNCESFVKNKKST